MALAIVAEGNGACKIAYCRVCLDVFQRNVGKGRPRVRCKSCAEKDYRRKRKRKQSNKRKSRIKTEFNCRQCGKAFRPFEKKKNKYCSHECAFAGLRVDRRAKKEERRALMPGKFSPIHLCTCRVCAKAFYSKRKLSALCSDECAKREACRRTFEYNARFKVVKPVNCKECGAVFVAQYGDGRRTYCSHKCSAKAARRISKPKRRALLRAVSVESVDPLKVFDRDGWRCQICHRPTPKRLRGKMDERAPELDHIIPLARGGEHSYRNTQCACRKCNGAKSATVYGQLNLFAS